MLEFQSHLIIFLKWLLTSYAPIWLLAHYSLFGWIIGWQLLKRSLKTKRMSNWHATFTVDLHLVYIINKSIILLMHVTFQFKFKATFVQCDKLFWLYSLNFHDIPQVHLCYSMGLLCDRILLNIYGFFFPYTVILPNQPNWDTNKFDLIKNPYKGGYKHFVETLIPKHEVNFKSSILVRNILKITRRKLQYLFNIKLLFSCWFFQRSI